MRTLDNLRKTAFLLTVIFASHGLSQFLWAHPGCGSPGCGSSASKKSSGGGQTMLGGVDLGSDRGVTNGSKMAPRHGGYVSATSHHFCEVVFEPHQTKVFLYSPGQAPYNARGITGEVILKVNGDAKEYRYPLQVVAEPTWTGDRGCLAANIDVSRVLDGDMDVTFRLQKPYDSAERNIEFSQAFHLSATRPTITTEAFTEEDYRFVAQQAICPVTGGVLADQVSPIKVVVGQQPVYVCCASCAAQVERNPAMYVRKARQSFRANSPKRNPAIQALPLNPADCVAINRQVWCPVKRIRLGEAGTPVKLRVGDRNIFVASPECIGAVEQDPNHYLEEVDRIHGFVTRAQQDHAARR